MAVEITKENFNDIVKNNKLVVVDFWAPWCGPCRMIAPIIDEIAKEYEDKGVVVGKVNTDEQQELAMQFQIRSIPTILIIKNGEVVDGVIGAVPKNMLEAKIEQHLED